jgi:hypothetical protein
VRAQKQVISVYTSISADSSAPSIGRFSSYERNRGRHRLNSSSMSTMSSRVSLKEDANCAGAVSLGTDGSLDQGRRYHEDDFQATPYETRRFCISTATNSYDCSEIVYMRQD